MTFKDATCNTTFDFDSNSTYRTDYWCWRGSPLGRTCRKAETHNETLKLIWIGYITP